MKKRGIVWFRQDLRLHDNEAIHEALRLCDELVYVYVFDDRWVKGATKFGAYACIITVAVTWFYFFAKAGWGGEYTVFSSEHRSDDGIMPVAICFAAGLVAMVGVSLVTRKPSDETIRKFFPNHSD